MEKTEKMELIQNNKPIDEMALFQIAEKKLKESEQIVFDFNRNPICMIIIHQIHENHLIGNVFFTENKVKKNMIMLVATSASALKTQLNSIQIVKGDLLFIKYLGKKNVPNDSTRQFNSYVVKIFDVNRKEWLTSKDLISKEKEDLDSTFKI